MAHNKSILPIFMILGVIGINFVAARMAVDFQLSFATSEWEKTNAVSIALSMTLFGAILSGVTVRLFEKNHFVFMFLSASLAAAVLVYECHGAVGSMSNLNVHFEQSSDVAKAEKQRIEFTQEKINALKGEKLDAGATEKKITRLQNQIAAKESKAAKCPKGWISTCKTTALDGIEQLNNEANRLQSSLQRQSQYLSALDNAENAVIDTQTLNKKPQ